jgi:hypothetical protein
VTGFLGNVKAITFRRLVEDLITSYKKVGCNMSLKTHLLHSHLDSGWVNCGAVKHSDHFHWDISAMENTYKGRGSAAILARCCWMIRSDASEI